MCVRFVLFLFNTNFSFLSQSQIFHIDDSPTAGKDDITKFKKAKVETRDAVREL